MIDDFIDRKHGRKPVIYDLPGAEGDSRGDLRRHPLPGAGDADLASALAGYSLGEADILRRAMGKKKAEEMAKQRERFMQGAAGTRPSAEEGREDFRPDGAVRGLRLQQIALGRLRVSGLRHGAI